MKKLEKSVLAPLPLADESLTAVAGAKGGKYGMWFDASPVTNVQTNVSGPVIQIAALNGGDLAQLAGVLQGNAVKF
jgi:hypothetical protein